VPRARPLGELTPRAIGPLAAAYQIRDKSDGPPIRGRIEGPSAG
jgi:hypothetical protein